MIISATHILYKSISFQIIFLVIKIFLIYTKYSNWLYSPTNWYQFSSLVVYLVTNVVGRRFAYHDVLWTHFGIFVLSFYSLKEEYDVKYNEFSIWKLIFIPLFSICLDWKPCKHTLSALVVLISKPSAFIFINVLKRDRSEIRDSWGADVKLRFVFKCLFVWGIPSIEANWPGSVRCGNCEIFRNTPTQFSLIILEPKLPLYGVSKLSNDFKALLVLGTLSDDSSPLRSWKKGNCDLVFDTRTKFPLIIFKAKLPLYCAFTLWDGKYLSLIVNGWKNKRIV